ncbi:MAG: NFACT family protein [Firmicutes bacterium]|nr:NFACT family protein [Bacillota bacterium]
MPNDALNYMALVGELDSQLIGGRINKITMPAKDMVILLISNNRTTCSLLLSVSPQNPRLHLTNAQYSGLPASPAFLTHLRKHISGAIINRIQQIPFERVITFDLIAKTELGHTFPLSLIIEIAGTKSNIILVDQDNKITDCIKHISLDTAPQRPLLPRMTYVPPPPQSKISPDNKIAIAKCTDIYKEVFGLDKVTIKEAISKGNPADSLQQLIYQTKSPKPCVVLDSNDNPIGFCFVPYSHLSLDSKLQPADSLSKAMDTYYSVSAEVNPVAAKATVIKRSLDTLAAKLNKKLSAYRQQYKDSLNFEDDRIKGELITSNIYRIKSDMLEVEVDNYYCPHNSTIKITLNPRLTPAQNAAVYYKRFSKKKRAAEQAKLLETETLEQLDSIQTALFDLTSCTTIDDLADVYSIFAKETKQSATKKSPIPKKGGGTNKQTTLSAPIKTIIDGYTVFVGKNSTQNDRITRAAAPNDIWLHAQKIHGSHIIISNPDKKNISLDTIKKAASLAAYYSKGRDSGSVPVDYTLIRYVSRPKGSPLGKVIYTNQNTISVIPQDIN